MIIVAIVVGEVRKLTTQYKQQELEVQFRELGNSASKQVLYKYQAFFLIYNIVRLLLSLIGFNLGQALLPTILIMVVTFLYLLCIKFMSPYLNPVHSKILIVLNSVIFIQSGCILLNTISILS
jgi:hypothetical protein